MSETSPPMEADRPAPRGDVFDDLWNLFASPKLAIALILVIVAACLIGTLVMQAPNEVFRDPDAMRSWVERARPKYGIATDLLRVLGLFGVFQTFWFRGLLGLLAVNTIVCTVNRLPAVWKQVFHPQVRPGDGLFERGKPRAAWLLAGRSLAATRSSVLQGLRQSGYRAVVHAEGDRIYLFADRFRFARFGTILTHLGLVLVLLGVTVSGPLGYFEESSFAVPVGSTREVGHGTGLAVHVDEFADEYYPEDGRPKDYRSDLVLYKQGQEVARQTIRVNEPLIYDSVRFHQAYYGPAAIVSVRDQNGTQLFRDAVAFTWRSSDGLRPIGSFEVPARDLRVYLVGTAGASDPIFRPGEVGVEAYQGQVDFPTYQTMLTQAQPQTIAGLDFVFERELQFTGLRVVRDPGTPIIWLASALLVLGPILAFFFPHRRLWGRLLVEPAGARVVFVGAGQEMVEEVRRIAGRFQAVVGVSPEREEQPARTQAPRRAPNQAEPKPEAVQPAGRSGRGR